MNRPALLRVLPGRIPSSMKTQRRWVVWRLVHQPGRSKPWTKVPFSPWALDRQASSTDSNTWGSFGAAIAAYLSGLCDGIGFVLGDGWVGLDIDGCRDLQTGQIDIEALNLCELLNTYTEFSPSHTGIHAIALGRKPGPRCRIDRYELYADARYLTVTGQVLPNLPQTVEQRDQEIVAVYARLFGADAAQAEHDRISSLGTDLTDDALLAQARQDVKFTDLWRGDCSGYPSHSEADAALCARLSYWTGRDASRIDALFRRSGLYRQKWEREDYRRRTIECALHSTYTPPIPECDLPGADTDRLRAVDVDADRPEAF
jgi:putative DNA primase/helicase